MENEGMLRLEYLKATGQAQEAKLYEQYLRETGQWEERTPIVTRAPGVAADATRALPRERPNASGDLQALVGGGLGAHGRVLRDDVAPALAAHVLNATQAVPFARNAQAVAGMVGSQFTDHPMGYGESLTALDDATDEIPGDLRAAEQMIGAPGAVKPVGQAVKRIGPVLKAVAKEAVPNRIQKMIRAGKRAAVAGEKSKVLPMPAKARIADEAMTLEQRLGLTPDALGLVDDAAPAATLESRLGDVVRNASPVKQRSAPRARFDHFAEQMAKRQAAKAATEAGEAAEPTLEDLLSLSLEHIKKNGTMDQLNRVNPGRVR